MRRGQPTRFVRPGHSTVFGSGWARLVHAVFWAVLVLATAFQPPLQAPAPDVFHEGEYAMYGVAGGRIASGGPAVLTHGGIDTIPARMAAALCSPDRQIVCVRTVNGAFTVVCEAIFVAILTIIVGLGTLRAILAGIPAMATLVAYNGSARSAFMLQTGTPNLRELFVLAILLVAFALYRAGDRPGPRLRCFGPMLLGVLSGLGLFWIYNRGLFGLALTAGIAGGFSWMWRDWRSLPLAAIGCLAGLACVEATGLYGSIAANFADMLYWQRDSVVYAMPFDIVAAAGPAMPVYTAILAWGAIVALRDTRAGQISAALPILTLLAVLGFYGYQVHERPFAGYAAHVLWGVSLLFALLFARTIEANSSPRRLAVLGGAALAAGIGCTLLNIRFMPPSPAFWAGQLGRNARTLFAEAPRDRDLVAPGLVAAADAIRAHGAACTYTFSNEGLLYVLSNTPPCSRFAYPFYVGPDRQAEAIADLEQHDPGIVLWASSTWSDAIFQRGLAERTPVLAAWAAARFPYRLALPDGYELRARAPFAPQPVR